MLSSTENQAEFCPADLLLCLCVDSGYSLHNTVYKLRSSSALTLKIYISEVIYSYLYDYNWDKVRTICIYTYMLKYLLHWWYCTVCSKKCVCVCVIVYGHVFWLCYIPSEFCYLFLGSSSFCL